MTMGARKCTQSPCSMSALLKADIRSNTLDVRFYQSGHKRPINSTSFTSAPAKSRLV